MHTKSRLLRRWSLFFIALGLLLPTLACSLIQPDAVPTPTPQTAVQDVEPTGTAMSEDGGPDVSKPKASPTVEPSQDPVMVTIDPDGSGDYATLEEAMAMVPAGSTISLEAGSYVLDAPIDRSAPVTLAGAGMDATEVSCAAPGYVMRFADGGSFKVVDLTLAHEGTADADVLWVDGGNIELDGVTVSGAVSTEDGPRRAGMRFTGSAAGAIFNAVAIDNDANGIRVEDQATVTVEDSTCSDNGRSGLLFLDESRGTVKRSSCTGNAANGIVVMGTARVTIEDSTLDENGESGLAFFDTGAGSASNNDMMNNALHGISVNDDAQPMLEDNVCSANTEDGIVYFERSGGTARGNTCSGNGLHGIGVADEAVPLLEENVCSANTEVGIRYSGTSGGTAQLNEITENGLSGIVVRDSAAPLIGNNVLNSNTESGIAYFGSGAGVARDNEIMGNGLHGIDLYATTTPLLELNLLNENAEAGIRISGDAMPEIIGNALARNGLSGIIVREQAWPLIEDNWIEANEESGLIYFGSSGGIARGNEIVESVLNGIAVNDAATPAIWENILRDNVESGVAYFETGGGVLQENTITGNKWGIYVSDGAAVAIGDNTVQGNTTGIDDRRPAGQRPTPPPYSPEDTAPVPTVAPDTGILFFDDFDSPDPGWWTGADDSGEVWFEDGELRVLNWTDSEFATSTEPDKWFEDVAITVESRLVDGSVDNWHDVMCRRHDADNYYLAGYSADGYVKMFAEYGGDLIYYLDIELSPVVLTGTGVTNTMELICDGSTITFRLNGQLIGEFTDDVLSDGDIGFAVSSMDGEYSDVAFDNLVVTEP